jgi:hypothetical protein
MKKLFVLLIVLFSCTYDAPENKFTMNCSQEHPYIEAEIYVYYDCNVLIVFNIDDTLKGFSAKLISGYNSKIFPLKTTKCPNIFYFVEMDEL